LIQKKLDVTSGRLNQLLPNIVSSENGTTFNAALPTTDIYDFNYLLQLHVDNQPFIVNKMLGQKSFIIKNEFPFVYDPFRVKNYDPFFEKNMRKMPSSLENNLLLNTGGIVDNNIYLCLAKDILTVLSAKNLSEETTIKIYYPFLYFKNVHNLDELNDMRPKLIEDNKKIINEKTNDLFNTIDMFYDVYKLQTKQLNYLDSGITYIKVTLKPSVSFTVPLEVIFKVLHATEENPLIKYNPSNRQENVYRLYTDKISTDGRKIPYLKKAIIFKLIRNIGKTKSVSVYVENLNDQIESFVCEFNENGNVTIISEFRKSVFEKELEEMIIQYANPIISEIKDYLEQSGYKIDLFNNSSDKS
jgi:hypothetical protein